MASLLHLMGDIRNERIPAGSNKCFRWVESLLAKSPYKWPPSGRPVVLARGKISLDPKVFDTKGGRRIWVSYIPPRSFCSHGAVKVTFRVAGKTNIAYFDIGEKTDLGNFGRKGHWFFADDAAFNSKMNTNPRQWIW